MKRVFTIGYERKTLSDMGNILVQSGVRVVVDVREKAWSNRPEYRKTALSNYLNSIGIKYCHYPTVGNPSYIRKYVTSTNECLDMYREYIMNSNGLLEMFSNEVPDCSCLLCYEMNPDNCHRKVLIQQLAKLGSVEIAGHL